MFNLTSIDRKLGNFTGLLLVFQYFGSSGKLLNTGINHTLISQIILTLLMFVMIFFVSKEVFSRVLIALLTLLLLFILHYETLLFTLNTEFDFYELGSYVKYMFYSLVFFIVYYSFNDRCYITLVKYAKYILIVLFLESLIYLFFKFLGLVSIYSLFESVDGRFSGVFLFHNSLVSMFSLFTMSYFLFFGKSTERAVFTIIGIFLIILTGERSSFLGLIFLLSMYMYFKNKTLGVIFKDIGIVRRYFLILFLLISIIGMFFIYSIYFRNIDADSYSAVFRAIVVRMYLSYVSIIHLFESGNSIVGMGPFTTYLPVNFHDIYSEEISWFINWISIFFGDNEANFLKSYHDSGNIFSPSRRVNPHNTFVLMFYYFGYFGIIVLLYCVFLLIRCLKRAAKEIDKAASYQLSSAVFIISSIPTLFLLSIDSYLLLIVISMGYIGKQAYD